MKKLISILSLALVICCLTGCMQTVDEMYRIPKRSDAYNNLQSSIDAAMAGLTYCAPLSGENQQNVQMADLNGDGIQEYLVFAKSTAEHPLRILVFEKREGEFINTQTVECNGSAFDQVEYVNMDSNSGLEIVVGCQLSNQIIRSVSVYTMKDDELIQLMSAQYSKFLTVDFNNDNQKELFLLRPGEVETDNGVTELYCMKNGSIERYNEATMSQPVDKLKRVITGKLDGGDTAVFVASTVGEAALITDIYTVVDDTLQNIAFSNETGTDVQTLRNFYIYADDIDNDTVVELPSLIPMKPMEDMAYTDQHQLIRWYAMTSDGTEVTKIYTYHTFVGGWYMQLDSDWAQRLVVKNTGMQYEFHIWDEGYKSTRKVFTISALTAQNREEQALTENRVVLHKTDSTVYAAQMEDDAKHFGITEQSVSYGFRMIEREWKTGET